MSNHTYVDLKECDLVEILKVAGGAKLIIKKLPPEIHIECTFDDCTDGLAEYVTLALAKQDYVGYACRSHLEAIRRLIAAEIPFDRVEEREIV